MNCYPCWDPDNDCLGECNDDIAVIGNIHESLELIHARVNSPLTGFANLDGTDMHDCAALKLAVLCIKPPR